MLLKKNIIFFIVILFTINNVFADTNGVWHKASDVQSGTFGSDEGNGFFYFQDKLSIATTSTTNTLNIGGDMSTSKVFDYEDSTYFLDSNLNSKLNTLETNDITLNGQTITNWHEGESDTFTDVTTRDSITSNSITVSSLIDFQNAGYYLNPDSTSVLNTILNNLISTRKLADLDDISYVLDLNSNSNFNSIDSVSINSQNILLNGVSIDSGFVNSGEANSITSNMIVDGTIVGNDLSPTYKSGSAFDSRFINVGEANSITSSMLSSNTIQSSDVNSADIQLRVSSTCAVGSSIRAIASDGTVTCEIDTDTDTNTQLSEATVDAYANNNGYLTSYTESDPQVGTITNGKWCRSDGTKIICDVNTVTDTDTTIADTNTNAATACSAGQYLDGDGSCYAIPVDTNTDTNANTACTGTNKYLDGDGNCDTLYTDTTIADTNTNAATICSGTNKYLDGNGNCDTIVPSTITCPCGTCWNVKPDPWGACTIPDTDLCTPGGWVRVRDATNCVCFAIGTNVVMFDGTNKDIETIIPGDYVINEFGEKDLVIELVEHLVGDRHTYMINGKIETTADHPFKTTTGWKAISAEEFQTTQNFGYYEDIDADVLIIGDTLVTKSGTEVILTIEKLSTRAESDIVYTLMLENGKAFYAEDYLVASANK